MILYYHIIFGNREEENDLVGVTMGQLGEGGPTPPLFPNTFPDLSREKARCPCDALKTMRIK